MTQKTNFKTPASESKESVFEQPQAHKLLAHKLIEPELRNDTMTPEQWVAVTEREVNKYSNVMLEYGQYIKRGVTILTIDMELDSDVNNWDMETLATIGMTTTMKFSYGADTFSFDIIRARWVSESGKELPYDKSSGEPVRN
ncbi:TPA: hypothetical protein MO340_004311 [Salmonella enterica subsp. salamae serovar 35:g,m,s,t:-]|nr:hypothetical protein [Salmonella enterica subsp. salamae serovar 35:g,m,s,t:-]HCA3549781.1 hypothetical protein [Salmonella enterica subsp. salamae serovar 35:g,m,s,t:-]